VAGWRKRAGAVAAADFVLLLTDEFNLLRHYSTESMAFKS